MSTTLGSILGVALFIAGIGIYGALLYMLFDDMGDDE